MFLLDLSVFYFSLLIFTILIKYQHLMETKFRRRDVFWVALALDKEVSNNYSSFGLVEFKSDIF